MARSGRQGQAAPGSTPNCLHLLHRLPRGRLVGGLSGVANSNGVDGENLQVRACVLPLTVVRQEQFKEGDQVMASAKGERLFLEDSLQILLCALLGVETGSIVVRIFLARSSRPAVTKRIHRSLPLDEPPP